MLILNVIHHDNREEIVELADNTVLQALSVHLNAKEVELLAYNFDCYKLGGNNAE